MYQQNESMNICKYCDKDISNLKQPRQHISRCARKSGETAPRQRIIALAKQQARELVIVPVAYDCKYECGFKHHIINVLWDHQEQCQQPKQIPVIQPVQEIIEIEASQEECHTEQELWLPEGSTYKYICQQCNNTSTHDFKADIYCSECEELMIEEDQEPLTEQQECYMKTYIEALKQSRCVMVCGRRQKHNLRIKPVPSDQNPGRKEITYTPRELNKFISSYKKNSWSQIQSQVTRILAQIPKAASTLYRIVIYGESYYEIVSTKIGEMSSLKQQLIQQLKRSQEMYQSFKIEGVKILMYPRGKLQRNEMVRGGEKIIAMNQKYILISPSSYSNCFYHCLVYWTLLKSKQYEKMRDQEYIEKTANDIKRKVGKNDKDYADFEDLRTIASYYNCKFTVYDNLFRVMNEIESKDKTSTQRKSSKLINQSIRLQFRNGHCLLMISKKQYPEFTTLYEKIKIKQSYECKPIIPRKWKAKPVQHQIMSYDLECYKINNEVGTQIPFAVGLCTGFNTETYDHQYQEFYSSNCINEFLDYLSDYKFEGEVYLYAHNGAKYDIAIVNEYLLKRSDFNIRTDKFMELMGGVINMQIENKHKTKIVFRDSMRIFKGSLDDLCQQLKPKFVKQTQHQFKFDDLNSENVFTIHRDEISDYLKHDCLSLAEIMINFRQQLIKDEKIGLDICDCFTSATLAKKLFFTRYYPKVTSYLKSNGKLGRRYLYELTREIDTDIRAGYFGGRCDIYSYGRFEKVYYYDFTSQYPYVGTKYHMPIGMPKKVDGKDINLDTFFGFIRCKVTTNKNELPLHGMKHDCKLVFAQHESSEIMLFSEEIKAGKMIGNQYEFLYGYQFEKCHLLQGIMKEGFQRKTQSKKEGKPIMQETWKIIINSAYGFFGLRWMDKRGVRFLTGDQLEGYLAQGKVYNYNMIGEEQYMVDMENDLYDIQGKNIAVAAAVTSYARMELYKLMYSITKKGYKVLYSDTDSIITNCNIQEHEDLVEQFQWDGCGDELGSLKNECLDKIKKQYPDILQEQIEHDKGELYFDECQILAPKVYSLRKTLINGKVIEIAKMKGCSNSTYKEQTQLLNGQVIDKEVKQFVSGKRAYMKDQSISGRVNVISITKHISQYTSDQKLKYSKGVIDGANVIPFLFRDNQLVQ